MFRFIGKNVNKITETFQRQRFVTSSEKHLGEATCSSEIEARGPGCKTEASSRLRWVGSYLGRVGS